VLWTHPERPGRGVRLAYCLNLHAAEDLAGTLAGLRAITLPLRERLGAGDGFGVGMYIPAALAQRLAAPDGARELAQLSAVLAGEGLDPFTYNAFPYGGFHARGLKRGVFTPTWLEARRLEFTLAVAEVARALETRAERVSISTHPGRFGPWEEGEAERALAGFRRAAAGLRAIEERGGPRVVLALEAEPRASAGDTRALAQWLSLARAEGDGAYLGACLDCCHSAVEFEDPGEAFDLATRGGAPLGKLQFSSAPALARPGGDEAARAQLLGMDEAVYLHQVTGRRGAELLRVADLSDLAAALAGDEAPAWLACDEWRCHFHVPVDLEALAGGALGTTRAHADGVLDAALAAPERWGGDELQVEIETYTWDVLPGPARGPGGLVDGLEREYRHVMGRLSAAGWRPANGPGRR